MSFSAHDNEQNPSQNQSEPAAAGALTRRTVVKGAAAAGGAIAVSSVLVACGGGSSPTKAKAAPATSAGESGTPVKGGSVFRAAGPRRPSTPAPSPPRRILRARVPATSRSCCSPVTAR
jgi:hypothetical protein